MRGRKFLVLMLVLVTLLSVVSAGAAEMRGVAASPSLSFVGTTAICTGECIANTTADKVVIRLVLYEDDVYETMWRAEGDGYAIINETYPAESGKTYKLSLSYTVNGLTVPAATVTKTCP